MADFEKVIKGLQTCVDGECKECPYGGTCSDAEDFVALARDALEILKAQQPRVLTLEEVKESEGKDLILEYRPWGCEDSIATAATIERCGTKGVSFVMSVACEYVSYNRKHSLGWRCWNVRPTDAERKAEKWDD